jgi:type I restriction enzyme S subunit
MNKQILCRNYPDNWTISPLSAFALEGNGNFVDGPFGSDLKVSDYTDSGVRILQLQNLGDGIFIDQNKIYTTEAKAAQIARCITKPGDLIIAKMAEPLARATLVPDVEDKYLIVADLIKLRPSMEVNSYYLLSFINFSDFRKEADRLSTGTTRTRISLSTLKNIGLPKPPIETQDSIALILKTIDQSIEKTEALINKYQQIKAGLMHDLFTRGLTADGKLRPPREQAPEQYKETPIGWIPKEWKVKTLKQIVGSENIVNGPFGSDLLTSELKSEGVPVLYVQDISPGKFDKISASHITSLKAAQLSFCNVRNNDVLVAKVGSPPCDACIYQLNHNAIVTQDVIRIRPTANMDCQYLSSILNAPFGRKEIKKISIEGTRERVSLTDFKKLSIPVAGYQEQKAIGERLRSIQNSIDQEDVIRIKYRKQKSGLMHDLLTGKVQVKIDPA